MQYTKSYEDNYTRNYLRNFDCSFLQLIESLNQLDFIIIDLRMLKTIMCCSTNIY